MAKGASATKVSIDTPCDISTVYRAIARIEEFILKENDDFDLMQSSYIVSNALVTGIWSHRSALGMNLYYCLITFHQAGFNHVEGSEVKKHMPGLRNKKQRDAILEELNNLTVLTDEEEPKNIKIFEFVEYVDRNYLFELTEGAYPYYYPLYHLFGRHPQFPDLCN